MVDPITLTGLALAGSAAAGGASLISSISADKPPDPTAPAAPPPEQTPAPKQPQLGANQPTFIGAAATPQPGQSGKSLLGQ